MARVSKEILKSFFQTGNKPNGSHFAMLIDSLMHYADRDLLGLKNYSPGQVYVAGDTVIYNAAIYQAIRQTTGTFISQDWNRIIASSAADAPAFGSDYEMAEAPGLSFTTNASVVATKLALNTATRKGRYRVQWSVVASHQMADGLGNVRLMNATTGQVIGIPLVYYQGNLQQKMPVGGVALLQLNAANVLQIQYQTMNDGMRFSAEQARIEIFKISD